MKSLKIGVCGVGNVGGAVLENLTDTPEIVASNGGVQIEIIQVGARKGKSAVPYDLDVVTDLMDVAENPEIDVFVELIGCLLYTSPSPRDRTRSRMPSSA